VGARDVLGGRKYLKEHIENDLTDMMSMLLAGTVPRQYYLMKYLNISIFFEENI